jgi:general stress protein 26
MRLPVPGKHLIRKDSKVNQGQDLSDVARAIIDSNMYMVLGTADASGQPWVSPVYFASAGYSQFYWVSSPKVRHSRNIATRSQVSIVVFNSQTPIGTGQGVYMSAIAEQLSGVELKQGIELFSRTSLGHGGYEWKLEDVQKPTLYRLYRATALEHWVLDPASRPDQRTPVTM